MSMGLRIPRLVVGVIEFTRGWILIYGRRKTGKTFLVRNMCRYDRYYFVTRTREIFYFHNDELEELKYKEKLK